MNGLIEEMHVERHMMWIRKAWLELPKAGFRLDDYLLLRGRTLGLI
jgi:hypothetical protein